MRMLLMSPMWLQETFSATLSLQPTVGVLWTGVHIPECVWLGLQVQTFFKGMDQEEEEKSEEREEYVFEKQERVIPILFTGT